MWSLVGRTSHTLFDALAPGDITWFRLHNRNHNPMKPRRQAFSTRKCTKMFRNNLRNDLHYRFLAGILEVSIHIVNNPF